MSDKDPFDFSDTSDLPEELQAKLSVKRGGGASVEDRAQEYANLLSKAPRALTLAQIIAAATRMDMNPPAAGSIAKYLRQGQSMGIIAQPKQGYYEAVAGGEAPATEAGSAETADDPLADL